MASRDNTCKNLGSEIRLGFGSDLCLCLSVEIKTHDSKASFSPTHVDLSAEEGRTGTQ